MNWQDSVKIGDVIVLHIEYRLVIGLVMKKTPDIPEYGENRYVVELVTPNGTENIYPWHNTTFIGKLIFAEKDG